MIAKTKAATAVKKPRVAKAKVKPAMDYDLVLATLNEGFKTKLALYGPALFLVETPLLFGEYLSQLPTQADQVESNCRACAEFMERYGRLVFINEQGDVIPAYWDASLIVGKYEAPIARLEKMVAQGKPSQVFYTDLEVLGKAKDGDWSHYNIKHIGEHSINRSVLENADQRMAQSKENYLNLKRALADFNVTLVRQALQLIKSEALPYGEVIAGWTEWFYNIYIDMARDAVNPGDRANVVWKHVAASSAGWCAVRGGLLGFLLKCLKEGDSTSEVIAKYKAKAAPDVHLRPVAPPKEGNIDQAEKIIERLGLTPSLARRYATLDDVKPVWTPTEDTVDPRAGQEGVFAGLRIKKELTVFNSQDTPPVKMTFAKFRKRILPDALSMQALIPSGTTTAFSAFTDAVNKDAPPLLRWDTPENRNSVGLYVYPEGSKASQWGLVRNTWVDVKALVASPYMRDDEEAHSQYLRGMLFVLDGAADTVSESSCLFPAIMRHELHSIRATIEAHSNNSVIEEGPEGVLCQGLSLQSNSTNAPIIVRVRTSLGSSTYHLYCWE